MRGTIGGRKEGEEIKGKRDKGYTTLATCLNTWEAYLRGSKRSRLSSNFNCPCL